MYNERTIQRKRIQRQRIGSMLIEREQVHPERVDRALAQQRVSGGRLGSILHEMASPEERPMLEQFVARAICEQYGLVYLPLDNYEIDHAVLALVPESVARQHHLIPIEKIGFSLTVSMADPLDAAVISSIEALTQCTVLVLVGMPGEIKLAIDTHYPQMHRRRAAETLN